MTSLKKPAATPAPASMMCNPAALVVDDESSIQQLLSLFLQREGFAVDCASSHLAAHEHLMARKYDLILVDIYLGPENGLDLVRCIREFDRDTHIVLITGLPDTESAIESLRSGVFDYLTKPLSPAQVIGTARRALHSKQIIEERERKQANLDAIFHSTSDGIVLVDGNTRLIQFNEAASQSCGYSLNDLGAPLLSIKTRCGGTCHQILAEVVNDGVRRNIRRQECHQHDGTRRLISLNVSPVTGVNGEIKGAVAIRRDETELANLEMQLHQQSQYGGIIGRNSAMQRMYTLLSALANVPTTVLVNGESGTGKELVAVALHHQGCRRSSPLVKVNCAALSEHLLESELFGHVRGAFTGAVSAKVGRFQKADGGTIFLDEIGDISPALQMRLLRVLQEQEFERVGDATPIKVDVRVVAATNQDLAEKVRLGTFRHDLFYRLNVVRIIVPPLRERKDDIPLLVEHFLENFSKKFKRGFSAVSRDVMELFMRHNWPGNVRELEHTIEHGAILCHSAVISVEHLPTDFISAVQQDRCAEKATDTPAKKTNTITLDEALEKAGGNKAKAARLLGVSRCTLYRQLQKHPDSLPDP